MSPDEEVRIGKRERERGRKDMHHGVYGRALRNVLESRLGKKVIHTSTEETG